MRGAATRPRHSYGDGLYWAAIAGVVLYVILDVVAQSLPPHYSPVIDAESDLAVGPYGFIMTINFVNRGLLSLALLAALNKSARSTSDGAASIGSGRLLFGAWAVGAILLAAFPTDVPATPVSWHGAIHLVVALVAFAAGAVGILVLSRRFGAIGRLAKARRPATALAYAAILLLIVELLVPFTAPHVGAAYGGLLERSFLGSVLLWVVTVSAYGAIAGRVSTTPRAQRGARSGE